MKWLRSIYRVGKGLYDILSGYLLVWVVIFAVFSLGLHWVLDLITTVLFDLSWVRAREQMDESYALGSPPVRTLLVLPFYALIWIFLGSSMKKVVAGVEIAFDRVAELWRALTGVNHTLRLVVEGGFSVAVTLLLIPFVVQPTLVSDASTQAAWGERLANLLDGTASVEIADSVVGGYRKFFAEPASGYAVIEKDWRRFASTVQPDGTNSWASGGGEGSLMDRWDPINWNASGGDRKRFAMTKAVMWVESAGRQFALSRTGCAGLMQFCAPTARSKRFRPIFGVGQVYTCRCRKGCSVDRQTQQNLEMGRYTDGVSFPCELTDGRFDPVKSIHAGSLYVDDLGKRFGYNPYLIYIGYNSGPRVAQKMWERIERNPRAGLAEISPHLEGVLQPFYGDKARLRAGSLLRIHLPKIAGAYQRYLETAPLLVSKKGAPPA
jgi:hypothetical protein